MSHVKCWSLFYLCAKKWCQSSTFSSRCNIKTLTLKWSEIGSDSKCYSNLDNHPLKSVPSDLGHSILKFLPIVSTWWLWLDMEKGSISEIEETKMGSFVERPGGWPLNMPCPPSIPFLLSRCGVRVVTVKDCPMYCSNMDCSSAHSSPFRSVCMARILLFSSDFISFYRLSRLESSCENSCCS